MKPAESESNAVAFRIEQSLVFHYAAEYYANQKTVFNNVVVFLFRLFWFSLSVSILFLFYSSKLIVLVIKISQVVPFCSLFF